MNELEMSLLGVSRFCQASRMAEQYLDISKFNGIYCQFRTGIEAVHCEVGDIIGVSHDVPSWTDKPFQVIQIAEEENDEMLLICKEYNSTIFRDEIGSYVEVFDYGSPRNPHIPVDDVTNVVAVEYNYFRDTELINRVDVFWTPPNKEEMEYLDYYLIEVSIDGEEFRGIATAGVNADGYRLENGALGMTYQFKIKTVSINNVVSDGAISDAVLVSGEGALLKHNEFQLLDGILSDDLFLEWTTDYNVNYYRKVIALKTESSWYDLEQLDIIWTDIFSVSATWESQIDSKTWAEMLAAVEEGYNYDKPLVATKETYTLRDTFDLEAARQVGILSYKVVKGNGIFKEYCRYKVNSNDIWSDWIEMPLKVFCRYFQVKLELQVEDVNLDKVKVAGYTVYVGEYV